MNIEQSATIGALAKALAAAQLEIQNPKKSATNPHFRSKYADLADVVDATRVLAKHGIAVSQLPVPHGNEGVCFATMLLHESGEWLRAYLFVPVAKADAQGFGSAASYCRRYGLAAVVNLAPEDDDAESAVGRKQGPTAAPAPVAAPSGVRPSTETAARTEGFMLRIAASRNIEELAKISSDVHAAKQGGHISESERKRLGEAYLAQVAKFTAAEKGAA